MRKRRAGFTLIELLAVVVMTALVLSTAVGFYIQTARASERAADRGARSRRAANLLDRIAHEIEGATLLTRPKGVDALAYPWLFLAERGSGGMADHLKFQTRAHHPRDTAGAESDLLTVAYWLAPSPDGSSSQLLRWASPQLPQELDRDFPHSDGAGVQQLAEPIAGFGVRLLDDNGQWVDQWDSSTVARANQLPLAAEIQISWPPLDPGGSVQRFSRRVAIPVRPLDLEATLQAASGAQPDGDQDQTREDTACVTVGQCIERNASAFESFLAAQPERSRIEEVLDSIRDQCFADHASSLGVVVTGCE